MASFKELIPHSYELFDVCPSWRIPELARTQIRFAQQINEYDLPEVRFVRDHLGSGSWFNEFYGLKQTNPSKVLPIDDFQLIGQGPMTGIDVILQAHLHNSFSPLNDVRIIRKIPQQNHFHVYVQR